MLVIENDLVSKMKDIVFEVLFKIILFLNVDLFFLIKNLYINFLFFKIEIFIIFLLKRINFLFVDFCIKDGCYELLLCEFY